MWSPLVNTKSDGWDKYSEVKSFKREPIRCSLVQVVHDSWLTGPGEASGSSRDRPRAKVNMGDPDGPSGGTSRQRGPPAHSVVVFEYNNPTVQPMNLGWVNI